MTAENNHLKISFCPKQLTSAAYHRLKPSLILCLSTSRICRHDPCFLFSTKLNKQLFFAPGGGALQAGRRLFQHEGGDPVTGLWFGLFRELGGCGHACTPPAGELRQRDQQCKSEWRVHYRTQPNCTSAFWAQLLQQWPFPCLHFWCSHWYDKLRGRFYVLCSLWCTVA